MAVAAASSSSSLSEEDEEKKGQVDDDDDKDEGLTADGSRAIIFSAPFPSVVISLEEMGVGGGDGGSECVTRGGPQNVSYLSLLLALAIFTLF